VRLFLVRHAHSDPGDPDELRPLSARGREQARDLAERLTGVEPSLVVASPLLRARETASAIAKATRAELRVDDRLAPGADAEGVLDAIAGADGPVVAVGHQPDCSEIAAALGAGERDFPTAGVVEVDLP
jgi:phosphohistidine phosphatase SixA